MSAAELCHIAPPGASLARSLLPATLFASGFWLFDAFSAARLARLPWSQALLPAGDEFVVRLTLSVACAALGALLCAYVMRKSEREAMALQQSRHAEHRYRALLRSSFESVAILDERARIVDLSDSAARLLGAPEQELAGAPVDRFLQLDAAAPARDLAGLFRDGATRGTTIAAQVRAESGRLFPAELRLTPIAGEDRHVLALRETTERIVADKARRWSEAQYRALFDNILDGVYRSRPDGTLLAANPALVRMLGYESRDELLQHGNTNALYKDPHQRTKIVALLEQHGVARNVELRLQRKDGGTLTVLANVRAIRDDSGSEVVYEGTLSDITDLLAARAALEDSEEHFRALTENARDIVNVIDERGHIVYSSPSAASVSGEAHDTMVGGDFYANVHGDDVDEVRRQIEQGFVWPGQPRQFTCRVLAAAAPSPRCFEGVATAYMTRTGELRAVVHSRDITARLATESQLEQLQNMQTVAQLVDGLGHEFGNLLAVMAYNLESLSARVAGTDAQPQLASARTACRLASDLLHRMLALTTPRTAAPEVVNVNALLLDLEPLLRRSAGAAVLVDFEFGEQLWPVRVDPVQLEGALLHLAAHALDAMAAPRRLRVRTRNVAAPLADAAGAVAISIGDLGTDSDEAAPGTTSAAPVRAGLGTVQTLAEQAGGSLRIASEGGRGARTTLVLPRHVTTNEAAVA